MSNLILNVPAISCDHCVNAITGALKDEPGVNTVQVDIPTRTVKLDYEEATLPLAKVKALLEEEGYPVESTQTGASV